MGLRNPSTHYGYKDSKTTEQFLTPTQKVNKIKRGGKVLTRDQENKEPTKNLRNQLHALHSPQNILYSVPFTKTTSNEEEPTFKKFSVSSSETPMPT